MKAHMKADELQEHMFSTYFSMRYGIAAIALGFPVLLYFIGLYYGVDWQNSMSHYYFAHPRDDLTKSIFPVRVWFFGILLVLGIFFYLYKGFSDLENKLLNLAAFFAVGVAVFPMNHGCGDQCPVINLHGICAVALFVCIAIVTLLCTEKTLKHLKDKQLQTKYRKIYRMLGSMMIASPVIALVFTLILKDFNKYTFFIEAAGIWAFAFYWWVKSNEMSRSGTEDWALRGRFET